MSQNRPVSETTERLTLDPDECWWGGAVADGLAMPFGSRDHRRDLAVNAGAVDDPTGGANQSAPLLVSSRGRYVWSEAPFAYAFDGAGGLSVTGSGLVIDHGADTLRAAYRRAAERHFPASGRTPDARMFTAPQYNTWIELPYHPTQEGVLRYARAVLDHGFPPGLIMIDDRWSADYGAWRFEPGAFPDPRAMIEQLHGWGFPVMLWLVPFLSPDGESSREAVRRGWVITEPDGEPAVRRWWNGYSTVLDLTNPDALAWLRGELRSLQDLGVDGFKLDAGDLRDYRDDDRTTAGTGPTGQCEAWARFATEFAFNELRACWKMGGQPLAQRLHDKPRSWGRDGLLSLIPEGIAQGLIGHAFTCPDMIGGGELGSFESGEPIDGELFVRFAQCSALFPMMQFSLTPWRVLDDRQLDAVRAAVDLRQSLLPMIMDLVAAAARTGEPVLRALAYHHAGYEQVHDQFLLGEELLVAPVLEQGATARTVQLPPGRWVDATGVVSDGPTSVTVEVGLDSLPSWRRVT